MRKSKNSKQRVIFTAKEPWRGEWDGMPAFAQEDLMPWKSMIVNFVSPEDLQAFAKLVGQTLTPRTRSIWYPKDKIKRQDKNTRYVDES